MTQRGMTGRGPGRKRRWLGWMAEAAVFLAIFLVIQTWQKRDIPAGAAPAIVAESLDGRPFSLEVWRMAHAGRAVALHFWAEWCPICRMEEGSISALLGDWPVMSVAMQSGTAEQVRADLRERGLTWPTVPDGAGRIARSYGLRGVPAFVVIGPQGDIRFVEVGYTSEIGMRLRLWWAEHVAP